MVERGGRLSVRRQSELLGLSRSSVYYTPRGASAEDKALKRRLDELYLEHPFYGSRQTVRHLRREGPPHGLGGSSRKTTRGSVQKAAGVGREFGSQSGASGMSRRGGRRTMKSRWTGLARSACEGPRRATGRRPCFLPQAR